MFPIGKKSRDTFKRGTRVMIDRAKVCPMNVRVLIGGDEMELKSLLALVAPKKMSQRIVLVCAWPDTTLQEIIEECACRLKGTLGESRLLAVEEGFMEAGEAKTRHLGKVGYGNTFSNINSRTLAEVNYTLGAPLRVRAAID